MAVVLSTIPHLRLVFGGTTGTASQEIWASTLKLIPVVAGTPPTPPTQAQAAASVAALSTADLVTAMSSIADEVKAVWAEIGGNSFSLDYVKLNAYGENNRQITDPTEQLQFTATPGPITCVSPWSSCLDFYHRTSAASRGFASHGRSSFPTGIVVSSSTGKIVQLGSVGSGGTSLATAASDWAAFLVAVQEASPGAQWYPGIIYTDTKGIKPPRCNIINRIIASDIPGEVRTRENALVQGSTPTVVPYT